MKKFFLRVAFVGLLVAAVSASSRADQSVVVPNGNTDVSGDTEIGEVLNGYNSDTGQVVQYDISAADLTSLQNTVLTGIAFRLSNMYDPSLPAIFYDNFTVELSAAAGSSLTPVFADNIVNGTVVYNDSFSFAADAFPTGAPAYSSIPNGFGAYIKFSTPYDYTTGDLIVTLGHSQPVGAEDSSYWSVDANSSDTQTTLIAHDEDATSQSLAVSVVPITEFTTSTSLADNAPLPIPEPGTYALALGSFGVLVLLKKIIRWIPISR